MTHTERIRAMLEGRPLDRPPYMAWGPHANLEDRHVGDFTKSTIDYQLMHDFDIVKVMPNGLYHTEDYGQQVRWGEHIEDMSYKNTVRCALNSLEDWANVTMKDVSKGAYGREVEVVRRVCEYFKGEVPVLATVFGPANTAINISSQLCVEAEAPAFIEAHEKEFFQMVEIISETTASLMKAYLDAGAAGFFYAQWGANPKHFTPYQFERYIKPFDLKVLNQVKGRAWFTMLHVCGEGIYMDKVLDYPVTAFNWEDASPLNPTLGQVRAMTGKVLIGGLDRNRDFCGPNRDRIKRVVRDRVDIAMRDVGEKLVVSGGCEWNRNATHRFNVWREVMDDVAAGR